VAERSQVRQQLINNDQFVTGSDQVFTQLKWLWLYTCITNNIIINQVFTIYTASTR